ncbi:MAG: hypothetical protein ACRYG7_54705 [Janthinobacterium lividum]
MERAFRDPQGLVHILGATTTVAAGINTPASAVILGEAEFAGEDQRPFTIAEYKNMVDRAGRLGYHERGQSFSIARLPLERQQLFRRRSSANPRTCALRLVTGTWRPGCCAC